MSELPPDPDNGLPSYELSGVERQLEELASIQDGHAAELHQTGIAYSAYRYLQEKFTVDEVPGIPFRDSKPVVYRDPALLNPGSPEDFTFGIHFRQTRFAGRIPVASPEGYDVPVGVFRNGKVAELQNPPYANSISNIRRVYSLVHELLTAKSSGTLPDLRLDLTQINDPTPSHRLPQPPFSQ